MYPRHMNYASNLIQHYESIWGHMHRRLFMTKGPIQDLPDGYQVGEFFDDTKQLWIYATLNAADDRSGLEFHLIAPNADEHHVQTLSVLAHYGLTTDPLEVGHTLNLGEGWLADSVCDHLLLSLPYLYGKNLELFNHHEMNVRCLWVLPITRNERAFKAEHGLEALESKFEEHGIEFADPSRVSVV